MIGFLFVYFDVDETKSQAYDQGNKEVTVWHKSCHSQRATHSSE
jgi:hypothetical protein